MSILFYIVFKAMSAAVRARDGGLWLLKITAAL